MYFKKVNPDLAIIMIGDFNQLPTVGDRIRNRDYSNSTILREICDYNQVILTKNRRNNNDARIAELIKTQEYTDISDKLTYFNVCKTNRIRKQINTKCMNSFITQPPVGRKMSKKDCLFIPADKDNRHSQDMYIRQRMPILCKKNTKKMGLINNQLYYVSQIDEENIYLTTKDIMYDKKIAVDVTIPISIKKINKYRLVPGFAFTVWSVQGTSINQPYTIHEFYKMSDAGKYVAITRATKFEYLNILSNVNYI